MKVVGVIPLWDEHKDSLWMLPGYFKGIEAAGAIPVMLPLSSDQKILKECLGHVDGILFTGGHDVSPELYGAKRIAKCGAVCQERDAMEAFLVKECIARDKPFLGICRGIQILNAVLGGTLWQDLPSQRPSGTEHCMSAPYDRGVHDVTLTDKGMLWAMLGVKSLKVNSYHHQAIKDLSPKLSCEAVSEDGLCEAARVKNARFALAVQWHPEFYNGHNDYANAIFKAFVSAL